LGNIFTLGENFHESPYRFSLTTFGALHFEFAIPPRMLLEIIWSIKKSEFSFFAHFVQGNLFSKKIPYSVRGFLKMSISALN